MTSAKKRMILPTELMITILSFAVQLESTSPRGLLAKERRDNLLRFSLVHRDWTLLSIHHLVKYLDITTSNLASFLAIPVDSNTSRIMKESTEMIYISGLSKEETETVLDRCMNVQRLWLWNVDNFQLDTLSE